MITLTTEKILFTNSKKNYYPIPKTRLKLSQDADSFTPSVSFRGIESELRMPPAEFLGNLGKFFRGNPESEATVVTTIVKTEKPSQPVNTVIETAQQISTPDKPVSETISSTFPADVYYQGQILPQFKY